MSSSLPIGTWRPTSARHWPRQRDSYEHYQLGGGNLGNFAPTWAGTERKTQLLAGAQARLSRNASTRRSAIPN